MKKFLLVFILLSCQNSDKKYEFIIKNDGFRNSIKIGKFAKLTDGYTYYEYLNYNDSVETLVFVHGFSVPSYIWDITYYEAIKRGYNVLRMDLYGRGFSRRLHKLKFGIITRIMKIRFICYQNI